MGITEVWNLEESNIGAFTYRIGESEFGIEIIDGVHFANMEQES